MFAISKFKFPANKRAHAETVLPVKQKIITEKRSNNFYFKRVQAYIISQYKRVPSTQANTDKDEIYVSICNEECSADG